MRVLLYKDLNIRRVKAAFAKVVALIEADDFRSADVKKLAPTRYWRAKLDYSNRLLLQFARYGSETVCLALEVIENHAYDKSRFLRGAVLDETKIERESVLSDAAAARSLPDTEPLRWLHASRNVFELLDKPIMFDDAQEAVRRLLAPVVVVGSAGSGKTAVTLAKLRKAEGRVLYVTLSTGLADFKGKVVVLFFGYTQCPDVCPTAMVEMAKVKKELGGDADKLQVVFVTVDPERDTQEVLKAYMENFDPTFLALRGTPEQLSQVADDFRIIYNKVNGSTPTSYTMDHSAGRYIYDTNGRLRLYARYGIEVPAIASDIRLLLKDTSS